MSGRGAVFVACGALALVAVSCGAAVGPLNRSGSAALPRPGHQTMITDQSSSATTEPPASSEPTSLAPAVTSVADAPAVWSRRLPGDDGGFPRPAWVAVPVITVWSQPGFVRAVDAPVVQAQPQVSKWIGAMSFSQKVDLGQRMATQALLDDPLTVLGLQGDWAHVLVDEQTGSVYTDGIDGWVPRAQIAFAPLPTANTTATVSVPFARAGKVELSYGTHLPVVGSSASYLDVATADGLLQVSRSDVSTAPPGAGGSAVLKQGEQFVGLPYLWAGTSAYGLDCSGLTYTVYRQFGVTLARDAADQAQQGAPIARKDLRPGDLVFFASGGLVHHVGIYAGAGMMLDAPETGGRIEVVPLWNSYLATQYAGARRYINT